METDIKHKLATDYWLNKISRIETACSLGDNTSVWLSEKTTLAEDHTRLISALAKEDAIGEYTLYLALYGILLKQFFNHSDVLVASPGFKVTSSGEDHLVFHCLNVAGESPLKAYIKSVRTEVQDSAEHAGIGIDTLRTTLRNRNIHEARALTFGFSYDAANVSADALEHLDFVLSITRPGQGQLPVAELKTRMTESYRSLAGQFLRSFKNISQLLRSSLDVPVNSLEILTPEEKHVLVKELNSNRAGISETNLVALFEQQVSLASDKPAVSFGKTTYSFRELNERCNQLAWFLRDNYKIGPDSLVGCLMDGTEAMIIAIVSVLKAGGAYVPIDPKYPVDRISHMIKDAGINTLITQSDYLGILPQFQGNVFAMDIQLEFLSTSSGNLPIVNKHSDLAYVIYTSGSTGAPKGVMIEHGAVVNLVAGLYDAIYKDYGDHLRIGLISSFVFDASVKQVFYALLKGHCLCIVPESEKQDGDKILRYFKDHSLDISDGTPSMLKIILNALEAGHLSCDVRCFIIGGEALPQSTVQKFDQVIGLRHAELVNVYGPTECCVDTTYCRINSNAARQGQVVPLGVPLLNKEVFILDQDLNLLPYGATGEICIGGAGLARGYINREDLTKAKFVTNGFSGTGKLYRSGDLGRWLADGSLQFMGRNDHQVKVRGFRIELGDIEENCLKNAEIRQAVATVFEEDGNKFIAVYYVSKRKFTFKELRALLKKNLPEFMLPHYFVPVEKIPLTINGKVNKSALPHPRSAGEREDDFVEPASEMEKRLAMVWQKVLGKKQVSVTDDFFSLGGDSIQAIQVASRMHEMQYKLEVKDIFQHLTIRAIAPFVIPLSRMAQQSVVTGEAPLTPIQQRFFDHAVVPSHSNLSVMLRFSERLDQKIVRAIFDKIVEHHDALRMTFTRMANGVVQFNHGLDRKFVLDTFDLTATGDAATVTHMADDLQASLDLENGPLMKVALFHLADGDRLLVIIHHLVVDGVSWRILLEDIENLYQQHKQKKELALPLKTDSFKAWAEKLREYADSGALLKQKAFWKKISNARHSALPSDNDEDAGLMRDATFLSFSLNEEETALLLSKTNAAFNTTINEILLSALGLALQKIFRMDKILISLEGHGREPILGDLDVSRTIGWFTSEFPVLLRINYPEDLSRQIKEIKEALRQIPDKGMGYGIMKYLTSKQNSFDIDFGSIRPAIGFNYLGQFDTSTTSTVFQIAGEHKGRQHNERERRKHSIEISGSVAQKKLHVFIEYNSRQFKKDTIEKLCTGYRFYLAEVIKHCVSHTRNELTPSDLTYKNLSIPQVDKLSESFDHNIADVYPLSSLQEAMLFQTVVNEGSTAYFYQTSFPYQGHLDVALVKQSLSVLFRRHDILRTVFLFNNVERPLQVILKEREAGFYYEDLRNVDHQDAHIATFLKHDAQRRFDLGNDVLVRLSLFRIGDNQYHFVLTRHHILMDAWSSKLLLNEYFEIYRKIQNNEAPDLPAVTPYKGFITWLESREGDADRKFWQAYLSGYAAPATFPKVTRRTQAAYDYRIHRFEFDAATTALLRALCERNHVTLNTALQVLWAILLMKQSDSRDVVFGSVVSGRQADVKNIENIIGLFINTVPVRIRSDAHQAFVSLLKDTQAVSLESNDHQHYPLVEICSLSPLRNELFDHIFIFENVPAPAGGEASADTAMEDEDQNQNKNETIGHTSYDMKVIVVPGHKLHFAIGYNANVYAAGLMAYIENSFATLAYEVLKDSEIQLANLLGVVPAYGATSPVTGIARVPDTDGYIPFESEWLSSSVVQRFDDQAKRHAQRLAVKSPGGTLTYAQLDHQANGIRNTLIRTLGKTRQRNIALLLTDASQMIPSLIGVLKSGNVYVPLDTEYPLKRLEYIMEDSAAEIVITNREFLPIAYTLQEKLDRELVIINIEDGFGNSNGESHAVQLSPDDIAYILYTSGSTGQPKGVVQTHGYVMHLTLSFTNSLKISCKDHISLFPSFNFSASIMDIFGALLNGASITQWSFQTNGFAGLETWLSDSGITIFHSVPSLFRYFMKLQDPETMFNNIRLIYLAGEPLTRGDFELYTTHFGDNTLLVNGLGCTEFNICRQMFMDRSTRLHSPLVPVGYKAIGAEILLVDDLGRIMSGAGIGEIAVKSKYLARGYWNHEELTSQKFLPAADGTGDRIYLTGDLGQIYDDGCLVHLGRKDFQVKIRGQRVEPVEVELAIERIEGIDEAVVVGQTDALNEMKLVAYMVGKENDHTGSSLKKLLYDMIPAYMVPEDFVFVQAMPKTPSGKIDRKALMELPVRKTVAGAGQTAAQANEIERQLIAIWEEVLNRQGIGLTDNFFELGGHSIKLMVIKSKIENTFNVQLNFKNLFLSPTVKEIALEIEAMTWVQTSSVSADQADPSAIITI